MKTILILLTFAFFINTAQAKDTITVATSNQSYSNYTIIEDGVIVGGLEYELMNAVCKKMNKTCVWQTVSPEWSAKPFPGILSGLNSNGYDVAIAFMRGTLSRMNAFSASAPYLQTKSALYGLSNEFDYVGDAPLKTDGTTVKFVTIGAYESSVLKLYKDAGLETSAYQVVKVETNEEIIRLIKTGEADFTFATAENTTLRANLQIKKIMTPEHNIELGPRIYSAKFDLIFEINKGLKSVVEDDGPEGYNALLNKYDIIHAAACYQGSDGDDSLNITENYESCKSM